jgi:twitching motility protein PilT
MTKDSHIITVEDPIEFVFRDQRASITQREVGLDTRTFKDGLTEGLRQDPDVIVIGEMRDPEVIRTAITAAETGHLVISTMHTRDARGTIERIIDVFPPEAQTQVRLELASVLVGIVSQNLLPKADGDGRVAAFEVLVKSPAIESLILKNELDQIPAAVAGSNNYYRMQTYNQAMEAMVRQGVIRLEDALRVSPNPADLQLRMDGIRHDGAFEMEVVAGQDESTPKISRF